MVNTDVAVYSEYNNNGSISQIPNALNMSVLQLSKFIYFSK